MATLNCIHEGCDTTVVSTVWLIVTPRVKSKMIQPWIFTISNPRRLAGRLAGRLCALQMVCGHLELSFPWPLQHLNWVPHLQDLPLLTFSVTTARACIASYEAWTLCSHPYYSFLFPPLTNYLNIILQPGYLKHLSAPLRRCFHPMHRSTDAASNALLKILTSPSPAPILHGNWSSVSWMAVMVQNSRFSCFSLRRAGITDVCQSMQLFNSGVLWHYLCTVSPSLAYEGH